GDSAVAPRLAASRTCGISSSAGGAGSPNSASSSNITIVCRNFKTTFFDSTSNSATLLGIAVPLRLLSILGIRWCNSKCCSTVRFGVLQLQRVVRFLQRFPGNEKTHPTSSGLSSESKFEYCLTVPFGYSAASVADNESLLVGVKSYN